MSVTGWHLQKRKMQKRRNRLRLGLALIRTARRSYSASYAGRAQRPQVHPNNVRGARWEDGRGAIAPPHRAVAHFDFTLYGATPPDSCILTTVVVQFNKKMVIRLAIFDKVC